MNREIKIPKTQYKEFRILIFSINCLFLITSWKISPKTSALLFKPRARLAHRLWNSKRRVHVKIWAGPQQRIRTLDSGMAAIRNWHFLVNPFLFVIGILKASPLCTYIYTFPWYRNFKFWNPVDPNPKTLCHQAYLRFGMRIAILFIAESLLALTKTLWPVLSWLMLKAFSSR